MTLSGTPTVRLDRSAPDVASAVELDDAQRRVVEHRRGPLLVLAGPGTGKTTTLVEAMTARLDELPAGSILGLTFGRRAAADWRARVAARCPAGAVPEVLTFHSFAFSLVRALTPAEPFAPVLRIASAAEQLSAVRELLREPVRDHGWPSEWDGALGTAGFAKALVDLINNRRTTGRPPDMGEATALAADRFLGEYLNVVESRGVLDYVDLIERARELLESPAGAAIRARYRAVYVDEYQDTDPATQRLLQAIVDSTTTLVAMGDPDQSIYSFRGADREGLLKFQDRFVARGGTPQVALERSRRFGPRIQQAAVRVLRDAALPGMASEVVWAHRHPVCEGEGSVEIRLYDSEGAQAAHIAEHLRLTHLSGPRYPWDRMAVLVRNTDQLAILRRAFTIAGVPAEVAGDDLPLAAEPAVQTMLLALSVSGRLASVTYDELETLLLGPVCGVDAVELRRFRRLLRERARELAGADEALPGSAELVLELFRDGAELAHHAGPVPDAIRLLRAALETMARARADGPHAALWALWRTTHWGARLERESLLGGLRSRYADDELDAICELFDAAGRADEVSSGRKGVDVFVHDIAAAQLPGIAGPISVGRASGVRLMTAHRAKGLEWDLVVVAGMQEGNWPDLGHHGELFGGAGIDAAAAMAQERRLAFVAATRARRELLFTGVDSDELRPSRFLADFAGPDVATTKVSGRPLRTQSLSGLVGELRTVAAVGPPALAAHAVQRLAFLADQHAPDGSQLVPVADPRNWWGVRTATSSAIPIRPAGPVRLSASQLEAFTECPQRWFLTHEAGGSVSRSLQMGFGSVIHAVAAAVVNGELPPDQQVIETELDKWWPKLGYGTVWEASAERRAATTAVRAFLAWNAERQAVAAEAKFDMVLPIGSDNVHLTGSIDRVDVDAEGRTLVADFKTGATVATAAQAKDNLQLALYQYVLAEGGLGEPGGADLVYLRAVTAGDVASVRTQPPIDSPEASGRTGRDRLLAALASTLAGIRSEQFPARPSPDACRYCSVKTACPAVDAGREVGS